MCGEWGVWGRREREREDKRQFRKNVRNPTSMNQQITIKKISQIKEILLLFGIRSMLSFSLKLIWLNPHSSPVRYVQLLPFYRSGHWDRKQWINLSKITESETFSAISKRELCHWAPPFRHHHPCPCHAKPGLWTTSISLPWEVFGNADSQVDPRPAESESTF